MPIYEYMCGKCETVVEKIHGVDEKPVVKCPKCGARARRKISRSSFHLKGSGWYVTDYGKKSQVPGSDKPAPKKDEAPAASARPKKPLPKLSTDPS
ncbi:MAG: FmdB family zinc ribbon protein [Thermodesulfobacteriota bacterium]